MVAGIALLPAGLRSQALVTFDKSSLEIETKTGTHKFTVEMAVSDRQQAQGLMFRRSMAPNAGMLFDYKRPTRITMWMKNTYIPLDMIFIGADGRIINIAQRTVPLSEATIPSRGRALAVLEVNGGTASRLGIKPGDRVIHPIFKK
ncbi:MAG: DUF192 domain-containing protein [Rhodospirillaceae bacterium]